MQAYDEFKLVYVDKGGSEPEGPVPIEQVLDYRRKQVDNLVGDLE